MQSLEILQRVSLQLLLLFVILTTPSYFSFNIGKYESLLWFYVSVPQRVSHRTCARFFPTNLVRSSCGRQILVLLKCLKIPWNVDLFWVNCLQVEMKTLLQLHKHNTQFCEQIFWQLLSTLHLHMKLRFFLWWTSIALVAFQLFDAILLNIHLCVFIFGLHE